MRATCANVIGWPVSWRRCSAWVARWRVWSERWQAAAVKRRGRWSWCGVCNVFERGDEPVEVVVDLAVVVGQSELAVGFGGGDE